METGVSKQFKKGVLELCVLYLLRDEDCYGYTITQKINQYIDITEGALYPVLRKLVKEQYCVTYLQESNQGPARKYYSITPLGKKYLTQLDADWISFISQVQKIKESADGKNSKLPK